MLVQFTTFSVSRRIDGCDPLSQYRDGSEWTGKKLGATRVTSPATGRAMFTDIASAARKQTAYRR